MTDDDLVNLSIDIDGMFVVLGRQYGIDPFILSSVVLARLSLMNMQLGNSDEWNKLIMQSIKIVQEEREEIVVH